MLLKHFWSASWPGLLSSFYLLRLSYNGWPHWLDRQLNLNATPTPLSSHLHCVTGSTGLTNSYWSAASLVWETFLHQSPLTSNKGICWIQQANTAPLAWCSQKCCLTCIQNTHRDPNAGHESCEEQSLLAERDSTHSKRCDQHWKSCRETSSERNEWNLVDKVSQSGYNSLEDTWQLRSRFYSLVKGYLAEYGGSCSQRERLLRGSRRCSLQNDRQRCRRCCWCSSSRSQPGPQM